MAIFTYGMLTSSVWALGAGGGTFPGTRRHSGRRHSLYWPCEAVPSVFDAGRENDWAGFIGIGFFLLGVGAAEQRIPVSVRHVSYKRKTSNFLTIEKRSENQPQVKIDNPSPREN